MLNRKLLLILLVIQVFSSCEDYPRDTYDTYEEVKDGVLLVGYTENSPWVYSTSNGLDGIEVKIIENFARSVNAEIEWVEMNEQSLLENLEHRNLHLVISGLTKESPWMKRIAVTGTYLEHDGRKHVIAVPPGEQKFLLELETFLNRNRLNIRQLLQDYLLEENLQDTKDLSDN